MSKPKKMYTKKLWGFIKEGKVSSMTEQGWEGITLICKTRAIAERFRDGDEKIVKVTITYEV